MKQVLNLLKGFKGHPSHPPLTGVSIGAYTVGTVMLVIGSFGLLEEKMAWGGFLAIATGLISAIPTVLTGFLDFLEIPRGTGMRRTANLHWVVMVLSTSCYLVTEVLAQEIFDTGVVSLPATLLSVVAFGLLSLGGWFGGAIVFVYGMRVENELPALPEVEAIKPKLSKD